MEGLGQWNYSLLVSFSVDEELSDGQIDLTYSEIAEFGDSDSRKVESLEDCPVAASLIVVGEEFGFEHEVHLGLVEEDGQLVRCFDALDGSRWVYFEFACGAKEAVVAAECCDFAVDRDWRDAGGKEVDHPTADISLRGVLDRA